MNSYDVIETKSEVAFYTGLDIEEIQNATQIIQTEFEGDFNKQTDLENENDIMYAAELEDGQEVLFYREGGSYNIEVRADEYDAIEEIQEDLDGGLENRALGNNDVSSSCQEVKETVDGLTFTPREAQDALDYLSYEFNVSDPVPLPGKEGLIRQDRPVKLWDGEENYRSGAETAITKARYFVHVDHVPEIKKEDMKLPEIDDEFVVIDIDNLKNMKWRSKFKVYEVSDKDARDAVIQGIFESLERAGVEDKR